MSIIGAATLVSCFLIVALTVVCIVSMFNAADAKKRQHEEKKWQAVKEGHCAKPKSYYY